MRFVTTTFFFLLLCTLGCSDSRTKQPPVADQDQATVPASPVIDIQQEKTEPPPASPESSHEAMLKRLQAINANVDSLPYFGKLALNHSERELGSALQRGDVFAAVKALLIKGDQETALGLPDQALKTLQKAESIAQIIRQRAPESFSSSQLADITLAIAVAALRKGENENCVHCQGGESCLFPIRGKGIHTRPDGSRLAIQYLEKTLQHSPDNLEAIWLLNVAHMTLGSFPDSVPERYRLPQEKLGSGIEFPKFQNISSSLGLDTLSLAGGAIADDFDGDHWLDIVVSDWHPSGQIRFFHNNGDGSFSDRTEAANLTGIVGGLNLEQADYDNDGDLDVLVLRGAWLSIDGKHPNSLLQNDGTGRFTDVTRDVGLATENLPTQTAAWSDFDNDGDLDLYVGNEEFPNQLFENDGKGYFTDVAQQRGVASDRFTKGVSWGDVNGDGFADLYVSNYRQPNEFFLNDGQGSFDERSSWAGVTEPIDSFPTWFWDYNNDGQLDLYVSGYTVGIEHLAADYFGRDSAADKNCLYQGDGSGRFQNVAASVGLDRATQPMGCNFGDLDNDGFLDFYLGTGYPQLEALMPNVMYHNQSGKRFVDVSVAGGFSHLQKGHGVAFADFDHDGDQDILTELGGSVPGDAFHNALFENPGFGNHWLKIQLVGVKSNRSAIGARIQLRFSDGGVERSVYRWVGSGGSFGCNPLRQEIGIGSATRIDSLKVTWPATGEVQTFENIAADQFLVIEESSQTPVQIKLNAVPLSQD